MTRSLADLPDLVYRPTVLVDANTCLTWPRFGVFLFGTVAVALLAGSLGHAVGVPFAMILSLAGAATLFHYSFRR